MLFIALPDRFPLKRHLCICKISTCASSYIRFQVGAVSGPRGMLWRLVIYPPAVCRYLSHWVERRLCFTCTSQINYIWHLQPASLCRQETATLNTPSCCSELETDCCTEKLNQSDEQHGRFWIFFHSLWSNDVISCHCFVKNHHVLLSHFNVHTDKTDARKGAAAEVLTPLITISHWLGCYLICERNKSMRRSVWWTVTGWGGEGE